MHIAPYSPARNPLKRFCAVATGITMSALTSSRPTVRMYNLLIVVLAAITVTTAMRTVGLLLVSALMVIPVATAQNLFKGFRAGLYGAMGIGVLVALSG